VTPGSCHLARGDPWVSVAGCQRSWPRGTSATRTTEGSAPSSPPRDPRRSQPPSATQPSPPPARRVHQRGCQKAPGRPDIVGHQSHIARMATALGTEGRPKARSVSHGRVAAQGVSDKLVRYGITFVSVRPLGIARRRSRAALLFRATTSSRSPTTTPRPHVSRTSSKASPGSSPRSRNSTVQHRRRRPQDVRSASGLARQTRQGAEREHGGTRR
jgi:hypothetical protein